MPSAYKCLDEQNNYKDERSKWPGKKCLRAFSLYLEIRRSIQKGSFKW